jgi:peptidoglycan/LPS O-acetylase OafA/YrhL
VPLFKKWQGDKKRIDKISAFITKGNHMLIPIALIIVLELLLRPFFHDSQTLVMDWANDSVYLSMFILGYVFAADERIQNKLNQYFALSKIFLLLSLALLFFINFSWQVEGSNADYLTVLWGLARGIYECSAIIFLVCICIGSKHLNKASRQIKYLSKASFSIYIFHFLPVTFFTLMFLNLKINIYLKYILVVVLSYLSVFLIYEAIAKVKLLIWKPKTSL